MMTTGFLRNALLARNSEGVKIAGGKAQADLPTQERQTGFEAVLEQKNNAAGISVAEEGEEAGTETERQEKDAGNLAVVWPIAIDIPVARPELPHEGLLPPQLQEKAGPQPEAAVEQPRPSLPQTVPPLPAPEYQAVASAGIQGAAALAMKGNPATLAVENEGQEPGRLPDGEMVQKEDASAPTAGVRPVAGRSQPGLKEAPPQPAPAAMGKGREDTAAARPEIAQADKPEPAALRIAMADLENGGAGQVKVEKPLEAGDKTAIRVAAGEPAPERRIQAVEVLASRTTGDVRILHLKLTPENLGVVEARLRLTENGLHVELRATHESTARLLAADHAVLAATLEKSGFREQPRISVTVADHSGNAAHGIPAVAHASGELSFGQGSGQGMRSDSQGFSESGQEARPDSQGSGQNGRGGRPPAGEERPLADAQPDDPDRKTHAYRKTRKLVV